MIPILIEDIKKHLNVDFDEDDAYIQSLIDSAQDAAANYIHRPLEELADENGALPPAIVHAIKLLVGNWYANREPVAFASATRVSYTVDFLLMPYKRFVTPKE